jgi:hypothetical protein
MYSIKIKMIVSAIAIIIIGFTLLFFSSCEKDIGVDTVFSNRDITGVVIDWHNKKPINDAKITIIPFNSITTFSGNTNVSGNFSVKDVPVLPEQQKYSIRIEKELYEPKDILVNCDCTRLLIDTVQLVRLECGLNFANSILNFEIVVVDEEKNQSLTITNPTLQDVVITKVELNNNSDVQLDPNLSNTPVTIPANSQQINYNITFKPLNEKKYFDTLKIYTQCKPEPYIIILLGEGQRRKCDYSPTNAILLTATNKKDSVIIRNLSGSLDLNLTFLHLPSDPFLLDKNVPLNTSITIQPNQSYIFQVMHNQNHEIEKQDSIVFETNGDCGRQKIPIKLKIEKPSCEYISYITGEFTFNQDSAAIVIRNTSDIPLLVDITRPPSNGFKLIPDSLHYNIEPRGSRRLTIVFNPLTNGTTIDSLRISTNGDCGEKLFVLRGKYEEYGYKFKDLPAWDNNRYAVINPEYRYTGYRFADDKIIVDSIEICNSMLRFGIDSADIRFEGYNSNYANRKVVVTAYSGLRKIGNYITDNRPFTLKDWKDLIDANRSLVGTNKGCNESFSKGDVLLGKTRENKFVLVMINTWYQDIHDFDYLKIDYWNID